MHETTQQAIPTGTKVLLGADHGGFPLKEKVKHWLETWQVSYQDYGASEFDPIDDYPQYAFSVAQAVAQSNQAQAPVVGVLLCRSGGGMVIAANKVSGIRAVPLASPQEARHAKQHNDANVISLAADWLDEKTAQETLKTYLETPFSEESRHQRRIKQISDFEMHSKRV